jgi:CRISPR-associated endonuclease/helicase Cas3
MKMADINFDDCFEALTGNLPFPWQRALYKRFISGGENNIPASCNLPTGLGKTSVIAIWLIALATHPKKMPRRLVYVVNRRTVVDQTTSEVEKYRKAIDALDAQHPLKQRIGSLALSTLRGQFADNREWSADPSRPAVICGTVDMIGSRLLFSGYGVGFKTKPLHAGFLGQDALLVHDEAHLEPAFQKLLIGVVQEQRRCKDFAPFRVMELSATSRGAEDVFELTDEEKEGRVSVVKDRLFAKKGVKLVSCERAKIAAKIAELALRHKEANKAVLVFVRSIDDVNAVRSALTNKKEGGVDEKQVQLLTGTLRGLERDKLATTDPVFARFLPEPMATPLSDKTVYLVCTSAGEVGVDISADHMVSDLTTLDSMAQRLGRVNRRGGGAAEIDVVYETDRDPKRQDNPLEKARWETWEFLRRLPPCGWIIDRMESSPHEIGGLIRGLSDEQRKQAFAPEPVILPATDILFDAWAMTTIRDKMPGRPEVGPYLHGVADDQPQTTIAWRTELDLLIHNADPRKKLQAIFAKHRIRPHETVTTNSYHVVKFFETIAKKRPALRDTRLAILFSRELKLTTIGDLIDNPGPLNADPTLVLPASFGYLDGNGMLSADAIPPEPKPDEAAPAKPPLDVADQEGYELARDLASRLRVLIKRTEDKWEPQALPGGKPLPDSVQQEPASFKQLIKRLATDTLLRVRLVQPIEFDSEGEAMKSFVALAPVRQRPPAEEQSLTDHVQAVEAAAKTLADKLKIDEPFRSALLFAAKWHDEGKKADIWQRYIGWKTGEPLGKSANWCDAKRLAGYRHEFGSLLRIEHPGQHHTACVLPDDSDVKELALHLIAAHHGQARPHFNFAFDRDFRTTQCDSTHTDAIRRFARLQRKYGRWGLAYLESLLRAADWAASAGLETDDDAEELLGGDV